MKKMSRLLLFGSMILVLLTAACGADEGTPPASYPGPATVVGGDLDVTSTPFDGLDTTATADTGTVLETATADATAVTDGTATGSPDLGATRTPGIPVTGTDVVLVECQFCVDTRAHALLVLPDTATFEIVSPAPDTAVSTTADPLDAEARCSTVEVNNGKQVVLCSGPEMTPLVVNVCTDVNTCTDFPIDLLACPVDPNQLQSTPATDGLGTAVPGVSISTATPGGTTTPTSP